MPIYEYRCVDCGNNLEAMQKISDAPLTVCPKCAGKLEKQISLSGFQFKGSGWYISDYTNRGKEASAESKTGETKTTDSAKTDATATKTEPTKTTADSESTASAASASKTETASTAKSE